MIRRIYASMTRVFFSCVLVKLLNFVKVQTNKHVLIVHSVPILCKPACVNAGTLCLYIYLIACTNKLS